MEKGGWEDGSVSKFLLCKHEDQSLDPRTTVKAGHSGTQLEFQYCGDTDRWVLVVPSGQRPRLIGEL